MEKDTRTHEQELNDFLNRGIAPKNPKLFLTRIQSSKPVEEKNQAEKPLVNENTQETVSNKNEENPQSEKVEKHNIPPLKVEGDATSTADSGGKTAETK